MSTYADAMVLGALAAMVGVAAISGVVMARSIQEEDAGSAWVWAGVFALTSLLAALGFWRLV